VSFPLRFLYSWAELFYYTGSDPPASESKRNRKAGKGVYSTMSVCGHYEHLPHVIK